MRSRRAFSGSESGGGVAAPPPPRVRGGRERLDLEGWPPIDRGDMGGDGGGGRGDGDRGGPGGVDPRPGAAELALYLALICIGVLFAVFCAIAVVVAKTSAEWPPPGAPAPPNGLLASTLLLVGCSVTLVRSLGALRRGARATALQAAWLAAALGVSFLCVQAMLWSDLIRAEVPASNGYVAFFYILTGLHAAHVLGGLVFLGRAIRSLQTQPSLVLLRLSAVYWHAMGVIWIAVFAILYLLR